jgi:hypothetical protein
MSLKEARQYRIEDRNDRNLVLTAAALGGAGAAYGWLTSPTMLGAIIATFGHGLLGALVGAPLEFAANLALGPLIGKRNRR